MTKGNGSRPDEESVMNQIIGEGIDAVKHAPMSPASDQFASLESNVSPTPAASMTV